MPLQHLVGRDLARLESLGETLRTDLLKRLGGEWSAEVVSTEAALGGGSLPGERLESRAVRLTHPRRRADELARRLRLGSTPVIGRIIDDQLHLDLRALLEEDIAELPRLVSEALTA
jgi:L-seryl-tRNA(Ser) seleniumtransferase